MSIRNIDSAHDWVFGCGTYSYVNEEQEIAVNLETRLLSFLGDCFFATDEGIDWWNLLDYNQQEKLQTAVQGVIIDTDGVTGINSVDTYINADRKITLTYDIQTIYSSSYTGEVTPV